jgi:hypothetical protein
MRNGEKDGKQIYIQGYKERKEGDDVHLGFCPTVLNASQDEEANA